MKNCNCSSFVLCMFIFGKLTDRMGFDQWISFHQVLIIHKVGNLVTKKYNLKKAFFCPITAGNTLSKIRRWVVLRLWESLLIRLWESLRMIKKCISSLGRKGRYLDLGRQLFLAFFHPRNSYGSPFRFCTWEYSCCKYLFIWF